MNSHDKQDMDNCFSKEDLDFYNQIIDEMGKNLKSDNRNTQIKNIYKEIKEKYKDTLDKFECNSEEPIRCIYHVACSGGTLITKCLASMPNIIVLNEIDPLSELVFKLDKPDFRPTDLISLIREGEHDIDTEILIKIFEQSLSILNEEMQKTGRKVLVRGHIHSHYFVKDDYSSRKNLHTIISNRFKSYSIVTVRDPIDSYISAKNMGWLHFKPETFDEYCSRYLAFLDDYEDMPIFKYEESLENPGENIKNICDALRIKYSDEFIETFGYFHFSGDSGRKSNVIEARNRQEISNEFESEINSSANYQCLKNRLGY